MNGRNASIKSADYNWYKKFVKELIYIKKLRKKKYLYAIYLVKHPYPVYFLQGRSVYQHFNDVIVARFTAVFNTDRTNTHVRAPPPSPFSRSVLSRFFTDENLDVSDLTFSFRKAPPINSLNPKSDKATGSVL
jgi:hypothetical protein